MAQARRAQAFSREQVVRDDAAGDGVLVLEQQASLLEDALLAGRLHIHQHVGAGQYRGETVHDGDSPAGCPDTLPPSSVTER
jgi:hypothetical protein